MNKKKAKNRELVDINTLTEMYYINSHTGQEQGLAGYIRSKLNALGVPAARDKHDQIYNLTHNNRPLLCAHMDQIGSGVLDVCEIKDGKISGNKNLGADDKNGVFVILKLLEAGHKINFIFSTEEEAGGNVGVLMKKSKVKRQMEHIPYAIVIDRAGKSDVIGADNDYCTQEFENLILQHLEQYNFKPAQGIFSDADELSEHMNCINISCGYYRAHTEKEFTVLSELLNTYCAIDELLKHTIPKMEKPEKFTFAGFGGRHSQWWRDTMVGDSMMEEQHPLDDLFYKSDVKGDRKREQEKWDVAENLVMSMSQNDVFNMLCDEYGYNEYDLDGYDNGELEQILTYEIGLTLEDEMLFDGTSDNGELSREKGKSNGEKNY